MSDETAREKAEGRTARLRSHLPSPREAAKTATELAGVALVVVALGLVWLPLALLTLGLALIVGVNLPAIVQHRSRRSPLE